MSFLIILSLHDGVLWRVGLTFLAYSGHARISDHSFVHCCFNIRVCLYVVVFILIGISFYFNHVIILQ